MEANKKKIGILCICLNPPYWAFPGEMIKGLDRYFLKHPTIKDKYETEIMLWSDIPETKDEITFKVIENYVFRGLAQTSLISSKETQVTAEGNGMAEIQGIIDSAMNTRKIAKIFPIEPIEWPMPTLLRYNLMLQQEEYLRNFDYLFYIDVDMQIVDWIGEEIMSDGLTAAQHPMYALRHGYYPPYEPNPASTAYIPLPGRFLEENGKRRFETLYYAGGFQGGKTEQFISAMKVMRANIEKDFNNNYIARWNDESHWNRYLYDNPPTIVLSPSYIYPDSLISQYYVKVWGRNYSPKIMTLTKSFTTSKEAGAIIAQQLATM